MSKAVLFDLDGTIIDSSEGITKAVLYTLKHYGIEENDSEKLKAFIGPPLSQSFMKYYGFSLERADEAIHVYREYYNVDGIFQCSLYKGVEACLKRLKDNNNWIAIASSKPEIACRRILEYHNILQYFDEVSGASMDRSVEGKEEVIEQLFKRWPNIDKSDMVLVGDTIFDIMGANAKGIKSIAVSFGFGNVDDMVKEGALSVCNHMDELAEMIARI